DRRRNRFALESALEFWASFVGAACSSAGLKSIGAPSGGRANFGVSLATWVAISTRAAARVGSVIAGASPGAGSHLRGMAGIEVRAAAGIFQRLVLTSASIMFVWCSFGEPSNSALE